MNYKRYYPIVIEENLSSQTTETSVMFITLCVSLQMFAVAISSAGLCECCMALAWETAFAGQLNLLLRVYREHNKIKFLSLKINQWQVMGSVCANLRTWWFCHRATALCCYTAFAEAHPLLLLPHSQKVPDMALDRKMCGFCTGRGRLVQLAASYTKTNGQSCHHILYFISNLRWICKL